MIPARRQQFQRFAKIDAFVFLNESQDVAGFLARPAPIALAPWVDVEGRAMVVVERAETFEDGADLAQANVRADDIDNVVGVLDLLNLTHQGSPFFRQMTAGVQVQGERNGF